VDLLLVDQPEDDLDNQTLYSEVITRLLQLKEKKQFIFATHSPNIPVLGDAEQIIRCRYMPDAIEVLSGTIDSAEMQDEIIDVMEGGDHAFRKRKQIYESWSH
jgi:predicted ATP-dependent endonuclease of OLD family